MPALVDTGIDFIETFEQNGGDLPLAEAKELCGSPSRHGGRICLMGNFDCVTLARGTVEQAKAEARRCLREGMDGGGYVMATADEVPADAQWANLKAMADICAEEGAY
jgi:uroporphyrinogen-III decarboxylase